MFHGCMICSMHVYKIITAEIPATLTPDMGVAEDSFKGLLFGIEPPLELNPEVVSRALETGSISDAGNRVVDPDIDKAILIGSTKERTVVYVGLTHVMQLGARLDRIKDTLNTHIAELLSVMGGPGHNHNRYQGTDPESYLL